MKTISNILILLNPFIVGVLIYFVFIDINLLLVIPIAILLIYLNFKLYFKTHEAEFVETEKYRQKLYSDYDYLGYDYFYNIEYWKHKETDEIIEI